jgi:ribonuclease BN (tRNA processing enzyme)
MPARPDGAAMRVRFFGSGDAFGSGGRFQTCIGIEHDSGVVLLDCGASSLIAMKRQGFDPGLVDTILISHLHGDHFGGLPFVILNAQFGRRTRPLAVAGPPGLEARVRDAMEAMFPGSSGTAQRFPIGFIEMEAAATSDVRGLTVTPFPAVHASGAPAFALRVTAGDRTIAYSGDTEWTPALVVAAAGAALFICESYFFDKQVKFHLDYQTLRAHRHELTCRRLVLTHMSAAMLARLDEVEEMCAHDGLILDL